MASKFFRLNLLPFFLSVFSLLLSGGCAPKETSPLPKPEKKSEPPPGPRPPRILIEDGQFMLDGERFIVRGVGYEPGARPGEYPWQRKFDRELMVHDLDRIKDAGFNTVRCWSGYNEQELSLIEEEGLMVIQGIWVDPGGNFADPAFLETALREVDKVVRATSKHGNILMYLVMNEPSSESIAAAGERAMADFLCSLVERVHQLHPGIPVSFSNTCFGEFLDATPLDAVAFNYYMYAPVTVRDVLGYRGYAEWLRRHLADGKPLVVTEFGLSVSKGGQGRFGFGGNSPKDQEEGDLWMHESLIQAGADGGCVFNFLDGWWKNNNIADDALSHEENDPEEWYGIVGIESKDDPKGTPRPAYEAFKKANRAIWTSPVGWHEYAKKVPFEVYATDDVTAIEARTASGITMPLTRKGHWWSGELSADKLAGIEPITLTVKSGIGETEQKRTIVTDWKAVPAENRPVEFKLEEVPAEMRSGQPIPVVIRASSPHGGVVADRKFVIGYNAHEGWEPGHTYQATSDADGLIKIDVDRLYHAGVITLSISTGHKPLEDKPTWGEAFLLRVKSDKK
jgi:hypothetical protein